MRLNPIFLSLALSSPGWAFEIGADDFAYPDNTDIGNQIGGEGFNFDIFDGETTATTSDWDHAFGVSQVVGSKLVTANSGAKREYNGPIEGTGDPGDDGDDDHERSGAIRAQGRIFYRATMTRTSGASWSGISSYDFGNERVFFGVPSAANPASGNFEFGCEISQSGERYFSGIPATDTNSHTIVAVLDFEHETIGLWVDPDANDFYDETSGANTCDAEGAYTGKSWSTAARLASDEPCQWDDFEVATRWNDLDLTDPDDIDNDGMSDMWEMENGLTVGVDDSQLHADNDGLTNIEEYLLGTDPQVDDSDDDGFSDGEERDAGTNPNNPSSYPGAVNSQNLVGSERFDYPDGPIAGRSAGISWDADNSTENDAFIGHTNSPSDWNALFGSPEVADGMLVTQESGAKREYNGPSEGDQGGSDERAGAVNDAGDFESHAVYYAFEMTRGAATSWSGASSYDFGAERYLFGVPGAANPASGEREFAIHDLNVDQWAYSGIVPVPGQTYKLVAKLDFDANLAALYLNPDLDLGEGLNTPVATYPHTSGNWSTSVRLASGGAAPVQWDNLRVAYTWEELKDGPPIANDDSATMHHFTKARLKVLANDGGTFTPSRVTVTSPSTSGSTAVYSDGSILYQHLSGTPATDTFTYQVENADGGLTDTGEVTIEFTTDYRFDSNFVSLPPQPPAGDLQIEDAFPGITFDSPHGFSAVPGDPRKIFVTEGDGRIFLIPDIEAPTKILISDLSASVQHDNNELACKGIAVHPDWANNGFIYVTYNSSVGTVRLSRLTCQTTAPYSAGSELILIEQDNDSTIHNIGTCEFGPDGYLYAAFGDEGTQEDGFNNSQHVDRNLWSSIIRIDVDKRPGSIEPNPDPGPDPYAGPDPDGQSCDADLVIPRLAGEAHYSIPPDNPFIGATTFNGIPLDPGQVRTEIFAMGVRNPWQFSAEDTDGNGSVDEVWVGDVGRSAREEISILHAGDNGGWSWREGGVAGPRSGDDHNGAPESSATLTEPLWDYSHGGGSLQGQSITGGFIYRGSSIPSLTGKYVCADYVSGNIWSIDQNNGNPIIERLAGEVAIVGLLQDPSSGDILLLDRGNNGTNQGTGSIKRLTIGTDDSTLPATLTATNFFADLTDLAPNPGGQSYHPNLRFWSDHAEKSRWFLIQDAADSITFSQDDPWLFPDGMIWVKHFDYPSEWESFTRTIDGQNYIDRRPLAGSERRRLETRFLVRSNTGAYGISYRWDAVNGGNQTDASLVDDDGETLSVDITVDGNPSTIAWTIPSRAACMTCHTPEAGHALSFNTRQLNAPGIIAGIPDNQLSALDLAGYLTDLSNAPANLPRHYRPDEFTQTLESRVRSYLDVNCAYCHKDGGTGGGNWDGRAHLPLLQTGLINGSTIDTPLHPGDLLVVPENVPPSILFNRVAGTNGYTRMPPLATVVPDLEAAQLIANWISEEVHPYSTYDEWRTSKFGNNTSPQGAPMQNPDGDRLDNFGEWVFGTAPLLADDARATTTLVQAHPLSGEFRFRHRRLRMHTAAELSYEYRISEDLTHWTSVSATEESANVTPSDSGYETVTLSLAPEDVAGKDSLFIQVSVTP